MGGGGGGGGGGAQGGGGGDGGGGGGGGEGGAKLRLVGACAQSALPYIRPCMSHFHLSISACLQE